MVDIQGAAAPRFAAVKDAFAANFAAGENSAPASPWSRPARWCWTSGPAMRFGKLDQAVRCPDLTPVFPPPRPSPPADGAARGPGKLDYAQTVAAIWPDYAQAGKGAVTIEQMLSHQDGLSGFPDPMEPAEWFDWDHICAKLAAMAPLWPPGTASGYHPITFGYLAGEVSSESKGRTMGTALRRTWPSRSTSTCGSACRTASSTASLSCSGQCLPNFGHHNAATAAAFLTPWSSPAGRGQAEWRRMEIRRPTGTARPMRWPG